jgi:hypothetical protein
MAAAVSLLLIGASLPIWTEWRIGLAQTQSYNSSLWTVAWHLPANRSDLESGADFIELHVGNAFKLVVLLVGCVIVGNTVFRRRETGSAWWACMLLLAAIAALAAYCIEDRYLRAYHLLPSFLLIGYFSLLIVTWDDGKDASTPTHTWIARLLALKRSGALLPTGRLKRSRRSSRFAASAAANPESLPDGQLDRLVAIKRRIGSPEQPR